MATRQLYYENPEALDVEATVLSLTAVPDGNGIGVILDRTPFYPEGGGQPWDLGTIAGLPVSSVVERGGEPVHVFSLSPAALEDAGIAPGSEVRCRVDAGRRMDHTEQHTAQHLLSATVLRILGAPTRSFHLGERYSSIDVDIPLMDRYDADAVEAAVLEVIRDAYPVVTHLCPPENPDSFPLRRKPPADAEVLRILEIDGIDYTPCAGTHLRNTGAIHAFRILKTEKYKGMTRIYFLAGGRAQADYRKLAAVVRDTAASAGCAEDDISRFMTSLMDRTAKLESELKKALEEIASFEVQALFASLPGDTLSCGPVALAGPAGTAGVTGIDTEVLGPDSGVFAGFVLILCADRDHAAAARLAKAGAVHGRTTIAVSFPDNKVAAAAASGFDLAALFKPLLQAHGGKGGGSGYFQAAFPGLRELHAFVAALRGSVP
jgi:alanyl-tRNA synthetase